MLGQNDIPSNNTPRQTTGDSYTTRMGAMGGAGAAGLAGTQTAGSQLSGQAPLAPSTAGVTTGHKQILGQGCHTPGHLATGAQTTVLPGNSGLSSSTLTGTAPLRGGVVDNTRAPLVDTRFIPAESELQTRADRLNPTLAGSTHAGLGQNLGRALIVLSSAAPILKSGWTSGYHWTEAYLPWSELTNAGFEVDFVSMTGHASVDTMSVTDKQMGEAEGKAWHDKNHLIHKKLAHVLRPSDVIPSNYSLLYAAGGHAAMWDFPTAVPLQQIAAQIWENGGVVAAVCHGPALFSNLKLSNGQFLVQGRRVTGFATEGESEMGVLDEMTGKYGLIPLRNMLEACGGMWTQHTEGIWNDFTANDERLVTGMNPQSARSVAKEAILMLKASHWGQQQQNAKGVIVQQQQTVTERVVV